jgi:galactonate dehydratase
MAKNGKYRYRGRFSESTHNPSGPVATAASVQLCAGLSNFSILEFASGEVSWRAQLINPPEQFIDRRIRVSDAPGYGIELNDKEVARHAAS